MPLDPETGTTLPFPASLPVVRAGKHWAGTIDGAELRLTNLSRAYWPEDGLTKGDLLTYYFNVAQAMLPHLSGHPLTLKRMPEGVGGTYFYQKDAPSHTPRWMPVLPIEAHGVDTVIRFLTVRNAAHMLWIANLGAIEFHPHHSRGAQQVAPAYAVFDLDPFPPAAWAETRYVAGLVATALDRLGIPSFPKTSGLSGIQIYVPLDGRSSYKEVRAFVTEVFRLVNLADPAATTMEWDIERRSGKVFLDANMNRAGASLAAAYSVRAAAGAPVSMPFSWAELDTVRPQYFTMATALTRLVERGDIFAPVARGPAISLAPVLGDLGLRDAGDAR